MEDRNGSLESIELIVSIRITWEAYKTFSSQSYTLGLINQNQYGWCLDMYIFNMFLQ